MIVVVCPGQGSQTPGFLDPWLALDGVRERLEGYSAASEVDVVRHGTVLAVEAFEGTNACIKRGGELGRGKDVMLVKVSKPNQDFRFDVPVVGPQTIETCVAAGVGSITVESGKTLLLERETVFRLCQEHAISVHAMEEV